MSSPASKALLSLTFGALSMAASAQVTYRCGNSYSQTPCPGGAIIDTDDPRTREQKAQTDMATQRDARTANAMEKARLQQEARDLAANTPTVKSSGATSASKKKTEPTKKKKKAAHSKTTVNSAPDQATKNKPSNPASGQKDALKP